MNKMIIGLVVASVASSTAFAQAPATSASTAAVAPGVQTSTAALPEQKAAADKKWSVSLASENSMSADLAAQPEGQQSLGGAPLASDNSVSVGYKLTGKAKVFATQYFFMGRNPESLSAVPVSVHKEADQKKDDTTIPQYRNTMESGDLALGTTYSSDLSILGSKPLALTFRYDIPMWRINKERKKNGNVRLAETTVTYVYSPRWSMDVVVSPRLSFNSQNNPNEKVGGDTQARLIVGPVANYNFNDNTVAYLAGILDTTSVDILRGKTNTLAQTFKYEVGASFTIAQFTINPAISTESPTDGGTSSLFTKDSKVFDKESTSYNLNLYASF